MHNITFKEVNSVVFYNLLSQFADLKTFLRSHVSSIYSYCYNTCFTLDFRCSVNLIEFLEFIRPNKFPLRVKVSV